MNCIFKVYLVPLVAYLSCSGLYIRRKEALAKAPVKKVFFAAGNRGNENNIKIFRRLSWSNSQTRAQKSDKIVLKRRLNGSNDHFKA